MTRADTPKDWHTTELATLLAELQSSEHGLSEDEAARRLAEQGPNRLPRAEPPGIGRILVRQFQNPLIYILALAAAVSVGVGEVVDAGFIVGVLILNAAIGGYQEWRAEKSSHALQHLLTTRATVVRTGEAVEMDAEMLVPGDVVWLESGNRVPADIRLLSSQGLDVDESLLTGESLSVVKDAGWSGLASTPLGDRLNMAYAGSIVARGRAKGVVVATGANTVVGRLARDVTGATAGKPPLLIRLERFTRVIGIAVLAAAVLAGVLGVVHRGHSVTDMFMFAVALAVSAIPEGLPVALTVALAVATTRMVRRGVIVRRLAAVEGLGSCTLIGSDKTGTLTCNELTVRAVVLADGAHFEVTGEGYAPAGEVIEKREQGAAPVRDDAARKAALEPLVRVAALCNEASLHHRDQAWSWRGDPTDVALLAFGHKLDWTREAALEQFPQVNQIPFEPERKYAATFHHAETGGYVAVKGAPERVLAMCRFAGEDDHERLSRLAIEMAAQGHRVIALAEGFLDREVAASQTPDEPENLAFLGLVGMLDPLRPGVREAVAACARAGVQTTMITGDHPVTALAIARDLGLAREPDEVVSGADLLNVSGDELERLIAKTRVFARVAPDQKLEIVEAARKAGHFVAVTGDGVNDAAALRAANIGVAMGKGGTDVAREAADLVITDDNFATIVAGVEEGRIAYDNVRKVIYLLISTGAAEVVLVMLSLIAGLPLPLLPVQLLWLNLVTNGIQHVALAFEPGEDDTLKRPPRSPTEPIFNRLMLERMLVGSTVMGVVAFVAFGRMLDAGFSEPAARNTLLLLMVLFENVHIGNCRSETTSLFRLSPLRSPILLAGVLTAFLVHLGSMYLPPTQALLQIAPVSIEIWVVLVGLALSVAVAMELHKLSWRLRYGDRKGSEHRARA
jgi:P-type Ca2+ transporter type 2C